MTNRLFFLVLQMAALAVLWSGAAIAVAAVEQDRIHAVGSTRGNVATVGLAV